MILEDDVQRLLTARENRYEAEWAEADVSLYLVESFPDEYVRAVGQVAGVSHREIYRKAEWARVVPPSDRAADLSPRYQVQKARLVENDECCGSPKASVCCAPLTGEPR